MSDVIVNGDGPTTVDNADQVTVEGNGQADVVINNQGGVGLCGSCSYPCG